MKINEMAYSRGAAAERCANLADEFVKHFNKIYMDPKNTATKHWMTEMNTWFKEIRKIKLKTTNKPLTDENIEDWFFTDGMFYEDLFEDPNEVMIYKSFCDSLLKTDDVFRSIEEVM